jgi:uncharacterized protein (TIGR03663 family)
LAKSNTSKKTFTPDLLPEPSITASSPILWWFGCFWVTAVAAFLRCYKLGLKPFHHDEGVNGFFLTTLVREGKYAYNPHDYHGPTLYFFAWVAAKLFGLNGIAVRMVPVVFGIATVVLVLAMRRYIGSIGALSAGLLIAVSPGAVYISRYFIHESMFVFFTVAILITIMRWYETTNVAYLITAAATAALLFATKETAFISIAVLAIAGLMVWARELIWPLVKPKRRERALDRARTDIDAAIERMGGWSNLGVQLFAAVSAFIIVYVVFFSSFFTHRTGVGDSFRAYLAWGQTGRKEHTTNGWYAYFWWLRASESPLFMLGALGAAVGVCLRRYRMALFVGLWAWGMTAAYTLIPYKTPWLALNFVIPLAIASGVAIDWLANDPDRREGRILAGLLLAASTLFCTYQAVHLNFFHYDDDSYPYVYAHSKRDLLRLVDEINRVAQRGGEGPTTGIIITSPDHWPLPWYLRDYSRVGYFGQMTPPGNSAIMIGRSDQREELDAMLLGRYKLVGEYPLRPGVVLLLYVRNDLVDPGDPGNTPQP